MYRGATERSQKEEKAAWFWLHHVLEELMSTIKCTYPTLQDGNALLCHSCELRLTNIRKAETKLSDMKGIVRDQLATLCNPEKRSIAAECDPPRSSGQAVEVNR